jgi:hypothetical protein
MNPLQFYANIQPVKDFNDVMTTSHYLPCPGDWLMILTDIKGSTKAIELGRQKDVNLVGASAIAAVQNVIGSRAIPFTFGGDGATFVVPLEFENQLKEELLRLKNHALENYNLELRICVIPVSDLMQKNTEVLIGKYAVADQNCIALFLGSGFQLAEQILKTPNSKYELNYPENTKITQAPNLKHLSCRWDKIPTKYGVIVSVLMMSRDSERATETYKTILTDIEKYVRLVRYNPVAERRLTPLLFFKQLSYELKTKKNEAFIYRVLFLLVNFTFITFSILTRKNLLNQVPVVEYIDETFLNSDYKKLDGILKMVIDCTVEEKDNLMTILKKYFNDKKIFYGVHLSESSLMTCVVHDMKDNQHIHFIDGNNGGYAFAAKEMKSQIKAAEIDHGS